MPGPRRSRPRVSPAESAPSEAAPAQLGAARRRSARLVARRSTEPSLPDAMHERNAGVQSQQEMERQFFDYFGEIMSEWNPCNDDDGNRRFFWDEDVGAHDVEVSVPEFNVSCPERVRLRSLLDRVLNSEGSVGLRPVRRFMAVLCQTSARHTQHGEQKPVMGKHACFQGTPQNPQFRYGHARFCGMISCSAASSSMCWPSIAATLTSGRV